MRSRSSAKRAAWASGLIRSSGNGSVPIALSFARTPGSRTWLMRIVVPSGVDRATRSLAMVPPAPTTFSTMTVRTQRARHLLSDESRHRIRAPAGRVRHDDRDDPRRQLSMSGCREESAQRQRRSACEPSCPHLLGLPTTVCDASSSPAPAATLDVRGSAGERNQDAASRWAEAHPGASARRGALTPRNARRARPSGGRRRSIRHDGGSGPASGRGRRPGACAARPRPRRGARRSRRAPRSTRPGAGRTRTPAGSPARSRRWMRSIRTAGDRTSVLTTSAAAFPGSPAKRFRETGMAPPSLAKPGIAPDSSVMTAPDLEPYLEPGRKLFAGEAGFVWAASAVDNLPPMTGLEIAFAGRSNVGKSSLVNALTGRRTLARISNTPGRTQQLNFFDLAGRLTLVDMPGYGYAAVGKDKVAAWTSLIHAYLRGRANLARVYVLVDARHGLKAVDAEVLDTLDKAAVSYQVVLTKADALKPDELDRRIGETAAAIARRQAAFPDIRPTSSRAGAGVPELRAEIAKLLAERGDTKPSSL